MKPRTTKPRPYQLYVDGKLQPRRRFVTLNKALMAAMYVGWRQPINTVTEVINMQSGKVIFTVQATPSGITVL